MALIEQYMVVADHYPVNSAVTNLIEDMVVKLNTAGEVIKCTVAGSTAFGIAGDTKSTSTSGLPSTNASSQGAFVNRVSDSFDETKASGRCTVYTGTGSRFATDQYGVITVAIGQDPLYVDTASKLTTVAGAGNQIAVLIHAPSAYDSGVPGIDITTGSMTLGNYLEFKLLI